MNLTTKKIEISETLFKEKTNALKTYVECNLELIGHEKRRFLFGEIFNFL